MLKREFCVIIFLHLSFQMQQDTLKYQPEEREVQSVEKPLVLTSYCSISILLI